MTLRLDMVSDVVCPWCWLGFRRLMAALGAEDPDGTRFEVHFAPYELDPAVPEEGADYRAYMEAKFGRPEPGQPDRMAQMREALEGFGKAEGLAYDFAGMTRRPNTMKAHRLVRWASGQGLGPAMMEALFSAHFTGHLDIGEPAVLAEIAGKVGMDAAIVTDLLAGDADHKAVKAEAETFRRIGVTGVPTFIAGRRYALQGAQESATIRRFLADAAEKLAA